MQPGHGFEKEEGKYRVSILLCVVIFKVEIMLTTDTVVDRPFCF